MCRCAGQTGRRNLFVFECLRRCGVLERATAFVRERSRDCRDLRWCIDILLCLRRFRHGARSYMRFRSVIMSLLLLVDESLIFGPKGQCKSNACTSTTPSEQGGACLGDYQCPGDIFCQNGFCTGGGRSCTASSDGSSTGPSDQCLSGEHVNCHAGLEVES